MKRFAAFTLAMVMIFPLVGCSSLLGSSSKGESETEAVETTYANDWQTTFKDSGFTDDEISSYEEVLTNVGITSFHDVDIIDNERMNIIHGKIYDSDILQLNMTLEDRQIIYIEVAGIPTTKTELYINWRGNLKTKTVGTKKSVEMFSDTEGGYLAKLDWENKEFSEVE